MEESTSGTPGIGIPPGKLEKIFEPFIQVYRFRSDGADGVGLGLAISREPTRVMDGGLTATSEPGKGAVFTLSLPKA